MTTVNHPRLVKTRFFSKRLELDKLRCGRDNPLAADWRARARIPISAVLLSHMRASRDRIRVKLITGLLLIGFFIPSYLILSADFELKRPPTAVVLCSQPASLFNGELRWRKVKFVVTVKPRS